MCIFICIGQKKRKLEGKGRKTHAQGLRACTTATVIVRHVCTYYMCILCTYHYHLRSSVAPPELGTCGIF